MEYSTDPPTTSPPAELDHHPAANLFPLLEVESPEFGELVRDIREHGLLQAIVLCDSERDHAAEWARRPLARAAADTGSTSNRVRVAQGVKKADPELFEKVRTGAVPLRGAVKEVQQREEKPVSARAPRGARRSPAQPATANPPDASDLPEVRPAAVEPTNVATGDGVPLSQ